MTEMVPEPARRAGEKAAAPSALLALSLALVVGCSGSSVPAPPQPISAASPQGSPAGPAAVATASVAPPGPAPAPSATRPAPSTPVIVVGTTTAGQLTGGVLQRAWESRGYQVQFGSASVAAAGFSAPTAEVRLVKGAGSVQLALLVYPSPQALEQEWEIKPGAAPTPRLDRKSTRLNSSHIQKSRMPSSA